MKQELVQEGAKLRGFVKIEHFDNAGNLIEIVEGPNALTNTGFAEVAGIINSDQTASHTAWDYIGVGTGTTAATATDTALETEETQNGLTRAAGTGTRVTTTVANDTSQIVKSFSVTGSVAVTESGVLNASSTGVLLCRQTFSAINVANGDTLQITWKVKVA